MEFLKLGRIGPVDRAIRTVAGILMIAAALLLVSNIIGQVVLWVLGITLALEGIVGFCPMTYLKRSKATRASK